MPHLVLATCAAYPELSDSDSRYRDALAARGATVGAAAWNDGVAPFRGADLVVIRSTWDYHRDLAGYRAWLDGLEAAGLRVANPPPLVRWNLDKGYLAELAAAGIAVPAFRAVARERDAVRVVLRETGWPVAVVKPSVGASAHGVSLVTPDSLDAEWRAIAAAAAPHPLIVQDFVPGIRDDGQVSYVFLGGAFSHAVRHQPRPGEFRINSRYGPRLEVIAPAPGAVAEAARAVAALPAEPLYVRVDMVRQGDRQLVLEVEVNEPALLFQLVPEAADRFAAATLAWLARRA